MMVEEWGREGGLPGGDAGGGGPESDTMLVTGALGTTGYAAPELLYGRTTRAFAADVFSFGILLWELVAAKPSDNPLLGMDPDVYVERLGSGVRPVIPPWTPGPFADLMRRCWQFRSEDRPSMPEVVEELEALIRASGGDVPDEA